MSRVWFIGLGANLGDPLATMRASVARLSAHPSITALLCSSVWRSAPVDASGPDFLNAVVRLRSGLEPPEMLDLALSLEAAAGRRRSYRNAPRSLDIDLLMADDCVMSSAELTLPHPRMHQRAFVLSPLLEIEPHCLIPGHGRADDCLARCRDQRLERLAGARLI